MKKDRTAIIVAIVAGVIALVGSMGTALVNYFNNKNIESEKRKTLVVEQYAESGDATKLEAQLKYLKDAGLINKLSDQSNQDYWRLIQDVNVAEVDAATGECGLVVKMENYKYNIGDYVDFSFSTTDPCYAVVIYFSSEGIMEKLYPLTDREGLKSEHSFNSLSSSIPVMSEPPVGIDIMLFAASKNILEFSDEFDVPSKTGPIFTQNSKIRQFSVISSIFKNGPSIESELRVVLVEEKGLTKP